MVGAGCCNGMVDRILWQWQAHFIPFSELFDCIVFIYFYHRRVVAIAGCDGAFVERRPRISVDTRGIVV